MKKKRILFLVLITSCYCVLITACAGITYPDKGRTLASVEDPFEEGEAVYWDEYTKMEQNREKREYVPGGRR